MNVPNYHSKANMGRYLSQSPVQDVFKTGYYGPIAESSAPEVAEQSAPCSSPVNRPISSYSAGESTIIYPVTPIAFPLGEKVSTVSRPQSVAPPQEPEICGVRRRWFYLIVALLLVWVILCLGLGLGLGLGLRHRHRLSETETGDPYCRNNPQYCIGGALDLEFYSTKGAFNGSGIALAGESWNKEDHKVMTVYFQHWTGDIRWIQLTPKGKWIGGSRSEVIATDAKNATPISTVAYSVNETTMWHIFYINKSNYLRQKTNSNVTNIWEDGPLNSLNLKVFESPSVGLQACWYGNFYGDSDFSKFLTPSGENNTIPFNSQHGMHLWYPADEYTFRQYGWYQGQTTWTEQQTWTGMNGHAGVGCYSWGPGTIAYTMMVDLHNSVEIWWKDTNTSLPSQAEHPINSWQNSTKAAIPNVHPSTSLGYTNFLYTQMADRSVMGYNISYEAENTHATEEYTLTVGGTNGPVKGLGGTHLTCTTVWDQSGGASLYIFYQTSGDDVTVFTRDMQGGQWSQGELPIPDE